MLKTLLWMALLMVGVFGRRFPVEEEKESEEEKIPYSFSYAASRHYGGHPDREHKESRGPDGITRGVFRFVDPNLKVQEVVYLSDDDGFHVDASNIPEDTPVVAQAKTRHQTLFEKISEDHVRIGEELRLAALLNDDDQDDQDSDSSVIRKSSQSSAPSKPASVFRPRQSSAVAAATAKHHRLFSTISEQNSKQPTPAVFSPKESQAVQLARQRHEQLFQLTVKDHAKISEELNLALKEAERLEALEQQLKDEQGEDTFIPGRPYVEPEEKFSSLSNYLPKNTRTVQARRKTHQRLYNRIIDQHSRLAADLREKQNSEELEN